MKGEITAQTMMTSYEGVTKTKNKKIKNKNREIEVLLTNFQNYILFESDSHAYSTVQLF